MMVKIKAAMAACSFRRGDSEESEDLVEEEFFERPDGIRVCFLESFFPDLVRSHP